MIILLSITTVIFLITTISLGITANNYKDAYKRLADEHKQIIEINQFLRGQINDKTKS